MSLADCRDRLLDANAHLQQAIECLQAALHCAPNCTDARFANVADEIRQAVERIDGIQATDTPCEHAMSALDIVRSILGE